MGALTRSVFDEQMKRLRGLKFLPVSLETHWEALRGTDEELFVIAVDRAQRESAEFPAPRMLRMFVDQAKGRTPPPLEVDRSTLLPEPKVWEGLGITIKADREWRYYCAVCSDSGWHSFACGQKTTERYPWMAQAACQRSGEHDSHEWVGPCSCAESNPAVLRRKDMASRAGRRDDAA